MLFQLDAFSSIKPQNLPQPIGLQGVFPFPAVEKPVENVDNPPVVLPEIFHNVNFMLTYVLSCAFPEKASSIFPENVLK